MYRESAALYDLIYATFKDYVAEADRLATCLREVHPRARSVLDVACGTGRHAALLHEHHGFEVDGVDLDPAFVRIAGERCPHGRFAEADMVAFDLGRRYDVVTCLFSSIGYVRTLDRVAQALDCFRRHLEPGGIVVVEPWFTPDRWQGGRTSTVNAEAEGVRVVRTSTAETEGRLSRVHFSYVIEDAQGTRRAEETHELGLFTTDEMLEAFARAGLLATHDPEGLSGRGLYVARASEPGRGTEAIR